jgi:hypothetical protein
MQEKNALRVAVCIGPFYGLQLLQFVVFEVFSFDVSGPTIGVIFKGQLVLFGHSKANSLIPVFE